GGRIGTYRTRVWRDRAQVLADLLDGRTGAQIVGIGNPFKRGIGQADERLVDFGSFLLALEEGPGAGVQTRCKRDHGCDGTHMTYRTGRIRTCSALSPRTDQASRQDDVLS